MSTSKKDRQRENTESSRETQKKKFIREKIVPRKKFKRVIGIVAAVIGCAVLFGASAGAVFFLLQQLLKQEEAKESQVETIVIARDDISVSPDNGEGDYPPSEAENGLFPELTEEESAEASAAQPEEESSESASTNAAGTDRDKDGEDAPGGRTQENTNPETDHSTSAVNGKGANRSQDETGSDTPGNESTDSKESASEKEPDDTDKTDPDADDHENEDPSGSGESIADAGGKTKEAAEGEKSEEAKKPEKGTLDEEETPEESGSSAVETASGEKKESRYSNDGPYTSTAPDGENNSGRYGTGAADRTGTESNSEKESAGQGSAPTVTDRDEGPGEDSTFAESDLKARAADIQKSMAAVTIRKTGRTDWFSTAIVEKKELCGVIVAETSDHVLVLSGTDGLEETGSSITVTVDGVTCAAKLQRMDTLRSLSVLRVDKKDLAGHYEVLPLGNSLNVTPADPVWFSGFSAAAGNGLNEGSVTYVEDYRAVVDGYVQKISTNMMHYPGEQGILLNRNGELIGLVDDKSCTEGAVMSGWGISPLKYLLEDLCSGNATAFIGILCTDVTAEDAQAMGIPAGLYIQEVVPDSPAYEAGLLPGDRVVRLGSGSVSTNHMLLLWMDIFEPGKEITAVIERRSKDGYEPLEIDVTPGERK